MVAIVVATGKSPWHPVAIALTPLCGSCDRLGDNGALFGAHIAVEHIVRQGVSGGPKGPTNANIKPIGLPYAQLLVQLGSSPALELATHRTFFRGKNDTSVVHNHALHQRFQLRIILQHRRKACHAPVEVPSLATTEVLDDLLITGLGEIGFGELSPLLLDAIDDLPSHRIEYGFEMRGFKPLAHQRILIRREEHPRMHPRRRQLAQHSAAVGVKFNGTN